MLDQVGLSTTQSGPTRLFAGRTQKADASRSEMLRLQNMCQEQQTVSQRFKAGNTCMTSSVAAKATDREDDARQPVMQVPANPAPSETAYAFPAM